MISKYIVVIISVHLLLWLLVSPTIGATVGGRSHRQLKPANHWPDRKLSSVTRIPATGLRPSQPSTKGTFRIEFDQDESSALTLSASFTGYRRMSLENYSGTTGYKM